MSHVIVGKEKGLLINSCSLPPSLIAGFCSFGVKIYILRKHTILCQKKMFGVKADPKSSFLFTM